MVKNRSANGGDARDMGSIPGSGRSPGEGNGNTLQYSCLENPMTEEPGRLSDFTFTFHFHFLQDGDRLLSFTKDRL